MPVRGPPGSRPPGTTPAARTDGATAPRSDDAPSPARPDAFDGATAGSTKVATAAPAVAPARVELVDRSRIDVPSASGLVALPGERFLVVDDDKGIYLAEAGKGAERLIDSDDFDLLDDLEGITLSSDRSAVYVVEEKERRVLRLALADRGGDDVTLDPPEEVGRLPKLNRPGKNDGWEGLDVLPGRFSADGRDRLVAVHEGHPRRVGVFTLPDLSDPVLIKLPDDIKDHADDLSDVAVDRATGRVFLLSDRSRSLIEVDLVSHGTAAPGALLSETELVLIAAHEIDAKDDEKPEGITFDDDGVLWLTMDGRSRLLEFDVTRPADDD